MSLTLNSLNIDDWINYFATYTYEDPYKIQYDMSKNTWNTRPYITNYRQWEKVIKIVWLIKDTTTSWFWTKLRSFKNKVIWQNKSITIVDRIWDSYVWKYTCSWLNFKTNNYNIDWVDYELTIIITELLESSASVGNSWTATSNYSTTLTENYWWIAYPRIKWTWNTWSSLTKVKITISDSAITFPDELKTQILDIYVSWRVNTDYMDIDWKTKTILKNWVTALDYYWDIPFINPWSTNTIQVVASWTSINFTIATNFYITLN